MTWRARIDVEYDGSAYAGWQRQPRQVTVQGDLEAALARIFQRPVTVVGAGRTDAGVHARGQVAHADLPGAPGQSHRLVAAINALTSDAVVVRGVRAAPRGFHARRSATARTYEYRIARRPAAIGRSYVWPVTYPLRFGVLCACAEALPGVHSFTSFCVAKSAPRGTVCQVYEAAWRRTSGEYRFTIRANRFVHGMVRSLVGTMVAAAAGKLSARAFAGLLEQPRRSRAGPTAPASGLCLVAVEYGFNKNAKGV